MTNCTFVLWFTRTSLRLFKCINSLATRRHHRKRKCELFYLLVHDVCCCDLKRERFMEAKRYEATRLWRSGVKRDEADRSRGSSRCAVHKYGLLNGLGITAWEMVLFWQSSVMPARARVDINFDIYRRYIPLFSVPDFSPTAMLMVPLIILVRVRSFLSPVWHKRCSGKFIFISVSTDKRIEF